MCDTKATLFGIYTIYLNVVNIVNWKVIARVIEKLRCLLVLLGLVVVFTCDINTFLK